MKRILLVLCSTWLPISHLPPLVAQTTAFTENFGSPSGTVALGTFTGFQNYGSLTFSGTADIRNTTVSSGYSGATGAGNVFLSASGSPAFVVSGINTSAYSAGTLNLTFGAYKSATASNMTELTLGYSADGSNYTPLYFAAQPTGSGTTGWRSISLTATSIPIASNVSLKWTNSGSASQFRLDDIALSGTLTAVPEPSTYAALAGAGALAFAVWRRRRRNQGRLPSRAASSAR